MSRSIALPLACGLVFAVTALAADAQVAGSYAGKTADGHDVSIVVEGDSDLGFTATSTSVGFSAACTDATVLDTGWGYNAQAAIRKGKLKTSTAGAYFTINLNLQFSTDNQSATGTITTYSPSLRPIGSRPTKTTLCTSPTQNLTLVLQGADSGVRYPATGATMLGKVVRTTAAPADGDD